MFGLSRWEELENEEEKSITIDDKKNKNKKINKKGRGGKNINVSEDLSKYLTEN